MELHNYRPQSDWARRHYEEGERHGREAGQLEGEARALLAVLGSRGLRLTRSQRHRVQSCRDPRQMQRWLRRAVTVTTAAELLDDDA